MADLDDVDWGKEVEDQEKRLAAQVSKEIVEPFAIRFHDVAKGVVVERL